MKKFKVKIGYEVSFEVNAENKKEAEEYGWFEFDQWHKENDVEMKIEEIK